jgi:hypothetical protein
MFTFAVGRAELYARSSTADLQQSMPYLPSPALGDMGTCTHPYVHVVHICIVHCIAIALHYTVYMLHVTPARAVTSDANHNRPKL